MGFLDLFRRTQSRAAYDRTNADFLINEPDGFPSAFPPVHWVGLDSGGGALPIGPHGPWEYGITAPAVPAIIRATALITGPLTASPFRVLSESGAPVSSRPRWLTDPMLLRPDDRVTGQVYPEVVQLPRGEFFAAWIRNAVWWGLGAFLFVEDASGQPTAGTLRNIDPRLLSTGRDDNGALCWVLDDVEGDDTDTRVMFDRDGYVTLGPIRYRIVVLRNPHSPVDEEGMSRGTFALSPQTFRLGSQINAYEAGQFRSGVPNGYLKVTAPDLSKSEADKLKENWLRNHGGDRRSIAVLNAVTEFVPLNLTPVDADLAEVKRINVADAAFAFGLDPMTLGAALNTSGTYTNLNDAWRNHRDFGLSLWVSAVQDTLSALEPVGQSIAIDMDGFANPSAKDRFDAYAVALSNGILTLDEVRAMEGLPATGGEQE